MHVLRYDERGKGAMFVKHPNRIVMLSHSAMPLHIALRQGNPAPVALIFGIMLLLLLGGCTKEPKTNPAGGTAPLALGERFIPDPDQVMPKILDAKQRQMSIRQGLKNGEDEKPLQEAVWLAEALMNYEKGDASRTSPDWVTGTMSYTFPVFTKSDGSIWVSESDFYQGYEGAMASIASSIGEGKVYMLDHELTSIVDGIATVIVEWSDKDPTSALPGPYNPSGSGCHDVDEACFLMDGLLHWNFHQTAPLIPSFYVTLYPPSPYWAELTDNAHVEPNDYGYVGYFGTSVAQGGAQLLFNGNTFSSSVCFPETWNRLVIAREILKQHIALEEPYEFVKERVRWYGYNYGQTGIALYPTGYWHHQFEYKVGLLVTPRQ